MRNGRRIKGNVKREMERVMTGRGKKDEESSLEKSDKVSWCSPPTRVWRTDPWFPTCLPLTGQWGIPITGAALLAVDMDLTQQTHRRLLAALSFYNSRPSPLGSSVGCLWLFVLAIPSSCLSLSA